MSHEQILIVENETIGGHYIQNTLQGMGYATCGAVTTGEQALHIIEKKKPDLVLMNVLLKGGMDGIETIRHIPPALKMPHVFVTEDSDDEIFERAMETEPAGYIIKPFAARDLRISIEMALQRSRIKKAAHQSHLELAEADLAFLRDAEKALADAGDLHTALKIAQMKFCQAYGWKYGESWIPRKDGIALKYGPAWYEDRQIHSFFARASGEFHPAPKCDLAGRVWATKKPEWIRDVSSQSIDFFFRSWIADEVGFHSGAGVPVLIGDRVAAVLYFFHDEVREQDRHIVKTLTALAMHVGAAVKSSETSHILHETQEGLFKLASNIREVFWMCSIDRNQMVYVSPSYETIWGRSCESLYQNPRSWFSSIHPEDRDAVRMTLSRFVAERNEVTMEYRIVRPDGGVRNIRERVMSILDENQKRTRIAGVAQEY